MNTSDEINRRQLAISAGAYAALMGLLVAAGTILLGLDSGEVLEAAVFAAIGAALCIWFFGGDIIAMAERFRRSDRRPMK
jgi:uncharacterized membrane protein